MTRIFTTTLFAASLAFYALSAPAMAATVNDPDTGNLLCKGAKSCTTLKAACKDGLGTYQDGAGGTGKCTVASVAGGVKIKAK